VTVPGSFCRTATFHLQKASFSSASLCVAELSESGHSGAMVSVGPDDGSYLISREHKGHKGSMAQSRVCCEGWRTNAEHQVSRGTLSAKAADALSGNCTGFSRGSPAYHATTTNPATASRVLLSELKLHIPWILAHQLLPDPHSRAFFAPRHWAIRSGGRHEHGSADQHCTSGLGRLRPWRAARPNANDPHRPHARPFGRPSGCAYGLCRGLAGGDRTCGPGRCDRRLRGRSLASGKNSRR
jgi:hypothetical protein